MSNLYNQVSRYNEYIMLGIHYHLQNNRAPFAAYEKKDGEITGFLYLNGEDKSYSLSADDVVKQMQARFEQELANGQIISYVVLYHLINDDGSGSIETAYHFAGWEQGSISLPYKYEDDSVSYTSFANFTKEENNAIFQTQVTRDNAAMFADRQEIVSPVSATAIGQKLTWSNTMTTGNIWSGVLGFTTYQQGKGVQKVQELFAQTMLTVPVVVKDEVTVRRTDFDDMSFQLTAVDGVLTKSFIPVIKTSRVIDVENNEINEWENAANLEAVMTGAAMGTYLVSYFATDYGAHKALYTAQRKAKIRLSGLVYVLDTWQQQAGYSEDFTGYSPNAEMAKAGCFDFIGQLEDFRAVDRGYMMQVRLVTNPVEFIIDMFVNPENMRFTELQRGMKISGMVQLMGEIAR